MWWVHCNKCRVLPRARRAFFLTSCGHIICEQCNVKSISAGKCAVCGRAHFSSHVLDKTINRSLQKLFKPPKQLFIDSFSRMMQALKFRDAQSRFMKMRYSALSARLQKTMGEVVGLKNENNNLRRQVASLRAATKVMGTAFRQIKQVVAISSHKINLISAAPNDVTSGGNATGSFDGLQQSSRVVDEVPLEWSSTTTTQFESSVAGGSSTTINPNDSCAQCSQLSSEFTTPRMLGLSQRNRQSAVRRARNAYMEVTSDDRHREHRSVSGDRASGSRITIGAGQDLGSRSSITSNTIVDNFFSGNQSGSRSSGHLSSSRNSKFSQR